MYFGSVRFFKNLILLVVIICIAVPTGLAIHYRHALAAARPDSAQAESAASASAAPAASTAASSEGAAQSSALSADAPTYTALYPDFYADHASSADQAKEKTIYLTFDDGPSDKTQEILSILKAKDIKATFFVVGKTDAQSLQDMQDIVSAGHAIGMHSYSHEYTKIYSSVENYLKDMYDLFCLIRKTTGVTPVVFRMPGGSVNSYDYGIYQQILAEMIRRGFIPYDWNISSGDAESNVSWTKIMHNTVTYAQSFSRGIVLMHDAADKESTVEALPDVIDGFQGEGFSFDKLTGAEKPVLFNYPAIG
jgi:Predicted xylanase/chitin deacetylase